MSRRNGDYKDDMKREIYEVSGTILSSVILSIGGSKRHATPK